MSGLVASICVLRHQFTTAPAQAIATCPADHTMLIKYVHWRSTNSAAVQLDVWTQSPAPVSQAHIISSQVASNALGFWSGFVVLQPGDRVTVNSAGTGMTVWVSGSLLTGVAAWTPVN